MPIRVVLPLVTAALALLGAAPAAHGALQISSPSLQPMSATNFAVQYRVFATATGQNDHTRSEGAIRADVVEGEAADEVLGFIRDYRSKTKTLSLPNNPPAMITLQRGVTYSVSIPRWIAGGGGCGTCDEEGSNGPATTIKVPGVEPKERLKLEEKLEFSRQAAKHFERAHTLRLMTMLPFSGSNESLFMEAYSHTLAAQHYRDMALDPVDPKFRKRVKARRYATVKPAPALGAAGKPTATVLNLQLKLAAEIEATVISINRAQGAFVKRKKVYEKEQMLSASAHAGAGAKHAASLANALAPRLTALRAHEGAALDASFGPAQAQALSDQTRAAGALPAADRARLKALRVPALGGSLFFEITRATTEVAATTPASVLGDQAAVNDLRKMSTTLRGIAKRFKRAPLKGPNG